MKKLNELLGTEFPIIQGGMANIATGEFAAACSNAGALGVIATGGMLEADLLRQQIRTCKSLTDKPFGVNLMLMNPCADEMAQIIIEEGVQVVTTGAGSPGKYIPAWKEAGGHLGFSRQDLDAPPSLSDLLQEVLTAIAPFRDKAGRDIPVFVAGGVKNGADMARYMKEGAAGAQFATRFIATAECDASEGYKQRLLAAKADDITLVKSPVGMPGRALRSPLIRRVEDGTQSPPERCVKCIVTCDGKNAPYCISKALIAARNGDWENGLFFCGANAGEINTLSTVQQQMAQIMDEWRNAQ